MPHGDVEAVEHVLAQVAAQQDARFELQHTGIQRREDRPHPVLVEFPHHELRAFGVIELQADHDAVLPDSDEPVGVVGLNPAQPGRDRSAM